MLTPMPLRKSMIYLNIHRPDEIRPPGGPTYVQFIIAIDAEEFFFLIR